jgi:hypothetical protein
MAVQQEKEITRTKLGTEVFTMESRDRDRLKRSLMDVAGSRAVSFPAG